MAVQLICPHCRKELKVARQPAPGAAVRCYLCKEIFVADAAMPSQPAATPQRPPSRPAPAAPANRVPPQPATPPQLPVQQRNPYGSQTPNPFAPQTPNQFAAQRPATPTQPTPRPNVPAPQGPAAFQNQRPAQPRVPQQNMGAPNMGGAPMSGNLYGHQPLPLHPPTDQTPAWVWIVTFSVGGFGVLVFLMILVDVIAKSYVHKPVVAEAPAENVQPANPPAETAPAPARPTVAPLPKVPSAPPPVLGVVSSPESTADSDDGSTTPDEENVEVAATNSSVNDDLDSPADFNSNPFAPSGTSAAPKPAPADDTAAFVPEEAEASPVMAYKWKNGESYPYNFSIRMEPRSGVPVSHNGMVTYVPSFAQTEKVRELLKGKSSGEGSGTAFVIHSDGILVTCEHVVKGASEISVTIEGTKYTAKAIAHDAKHDLAILKIDARGLPAVPLGDSTDVALLQDVVAVGFPLSDVLGTSVKATQGTVAGMVNDDVSLIQVNAGINPGNSGGPLFNSRGEVLGICSAKLVGNEISNVGFAVPVNELKTFMKSKNIRGNALSGVTPSSASAMVKGVAPAVAYVEVKLGLDSNSFQVLSFIGFTSSSAASGTAPKDCRGEVLMSNRGEIFAEKDDVLLPGMVGNFSSLAIDELPSSGETSWESSRVRSITVETRVGTDRYESRFAPPVAVPRIAVISIPVVEKMMYKLGVREGNIQVIHKEHHVAAVGRDDKSPVLSTVGKGTIRFNLNLGYPISCDMQYVMVNGQGSGERVPVTFSYKVGNRQTGGDLTQPSTTPNAQPRSSSPSPSVFSNNAPSDRDQTTEVLDLLAQLKRANRETDGYTTLGSIARIPPIASIRDRVAAEVDPYLLSRSSLERSGALNVLEKWGTEDNVPSLMKLVDSLDSSSATRALKLLGLYGRSLEVVEKLVSLLSESDSSLRYYATDALKNMGPIAEGPVIQALNIDDEDVRKAALEILGAVGTSRSVSILQKWAANKSNSSVAYAAESALRAYERRMKKPR